MKKEGAAPVAAGTERCHPVKQIGGTGWQEKGTDYQETRLTSCQDIHKRDRRDRRE